MAGDKVYNSRAIANYLILKASQRGGLDPLQIMKLTYIAHGFALAVTSRPLIEDDVEAWKHGPVIRNVYSMLPGGSARIVDVLGATGSADLGDDQRAVVDSVYENYGSLSGLYLSTLTHREGSPWDLTWRTYGQNAVIPQQVIHRHYKEILDAWRAAHEAGQPYSPPSL
jgi:uncharacterized phage-associated protein